MMNGLVKGKKMLATEFEAYLNAYLNVSFIKDYCPNGLQVEGKKEIQKVATAVSANLETIRMAKEHNVDALIVHHGLFWNNDSYPIVGVKKKKIELLLQMECALFAYHLPLDAHKEIGNNWKAARDLGWEELEPFGEFNGTMIGVRGTFPAQSIDDFRRQIETYYEHSATVALGGAEEISSSALISGGAYKELSQAAKLGVDCFLTGNFDEPAWATAHEEGIHFMALGHSATERVGPKALADHIRAQLGLTALFIDVPNPF